MVLTIDAFRQLHAIDTGSFLNDLKSSELITNPLPQVTRLSPYHVQHHPEMVRKRKTGKERMEVDGTGQVTRDLGRDKAREEK